MYRLILLAMAFILFVAMALLMVRMPRRSPASCYRSSRQSPSPAQQSFVKIAKLGVGKVKMNWQQLALTDVHQCTSIHSFRSSL